MRQKCILIIVVALLAFLHSCKKRIEPNPIVIEPIDSTNVDSSQIPAKFKFSYELLDSGGVKFINHSKNISSFKWYANWYRSKEENPIFYFEHNTIYLCIVQFFDENTKMNRDTAFNLKIDNISSGIKIDSSYLSGTIYGEKVKLFSQNWNDFYGVGNASLPLGTPSARANRDGFTILVVDFNAVQGKDYTTMKNNFKVGKQTLAQRTNPAGDYSLKQHGWYVLFGGKYGYYATGNSPDDFLEILEVEEVKQRKLLPEMEDKAFWITWHVKANTGERGKIDCIFKTKYLIYETYFDF